MIAPMLVPAMADGRRFSSSRSSRTEICASPRTPPPFNARPAQQPLLQNLGQGARLHRHGHIVVHARFQAFLPVTRHDVGGHGNDANPAVGDCRAGMPFRRMGELGADGLSLAGTRNVPWTGPASPPAGRRAIVFHVLPTRLHRQPSFLSAFSRPTRLSRFHRACSSRRARTLCCLSRNLTSRRNFR